MFLFINNHAWTPSSKFTPPQLSCNMKNKENIITTHVPPKTQSRNPCNLFDTLQQFQVSITVFHFPFLSFRLLRTNLARLRFTISFSPLTRMARSCVTPQGSCGAKR